MVHHGRQDGYRPAGGCARCHRSLSRCAYMSQTAQRMIDRLNADLAASGEYVTLRRMARPPATGVLKQVDLWMVLTGYAASDMIQGSGIIQEDQRAIFSPTPLVAAG